MVVEIMHKLENYQLLSNTYFKPYQHLLKTGCIGNSSKYNILRNVSKSKYFIYPLINLDNNRIHYDTFGYVVLEALLMGTIVIAPKIKVYEELFGDAVCYIETDDLVPQEDLLYWIKNTPEAYY